MNHNHPLNNMGYQNLRMRLMTVLRKAEELLDIHIAAAKKSSIISESNSTIWTLKFRWSGDEAVVYVKKTKEEIEYLLKDILGDVIPKIASMSTKDIENYCFEREIAFFDFEEHTV